MHEAEQPEHAPQAEERATETTDRPWADLVHELLDDQFREFADEAGRSEREPRQTKPPPAWLSPGRHR